MTVEGPRPQTARAQLGRDGGGGRKGSTSPYNALPGNASALGLHVRPKTAHVGAAAELPPEPRRGDGASRPPSAADPVAFRTQQGAAAVAASGEPCLGHDQHGLTTDQRRRWWRRWCRLGVRLSLRRRRRKRRPVVLDGVPDQRRRVGAAAAATTACRSSAGAASTAADGAGRRRSSFDGSGLGFARRAWPCRGCAPRCTQGSPRRRGLGERQRQRQWQ